MDYREDISFWDFDIEELLEKTQEDEKQRLEQELERINRQLEERDRIHHETLNELESKLEWYKDRLEKLYKQSRGRQGRRGDVKNQIQRFYSLIREEKRSHWQDQQKLEERKSEKLRELTELEEGSVLDFIDNLCE